MQKLFHILPASILWIACLSCEALSCDRSIIHDWTLSEDPTYLCHGYYSPAPLPPFDPHDSNLRVSSDQGGFQLDGPSTFSGHVIATHEGRQILADHATVLRNSKTGKVDTIHATGNVSLQQPNVRLDGAKADFVLSEEKNVVYEGEYRLYDKHARGEASILTGFGKNFFSLQDALYTTCAPCQTTWYLAANTVDLNRETGRGVAKQATFYYFGIPILYTPYLNFPIDDRRQTGFLYPIPGYSRRSGFELLVPFYWNIAPNYDMTLGIKPINKRGVQAQTEFRYLMPHHDGILTYHVLPSDKTYKTFRNDKRINHPNKTNQDRRVQALEKGPTRWLVGVEHAFHYAPNWLASVNYKEVGDDNYFEAFGNGLGGTSTLHLLQQAQLQNDSAAGSFTVLAKQYQALFPFDGPLGSDVYKLHPQVGFISSPWDLPLGFVFTFVGQATQFRHKDPDRVVTGDRFVAQPSVSYPIFRSGWQIVPRARLQSVAYHLQLPNSISDTKKHPSAYVPIGEIDGRLFLERDLRLGGNPYVHTLEPHLYYLIIPRKSQNDHPIFDTGLHSFSFNQLYRYNRFAGHDRIGDTHQVTAGLTSRFLNPTSGTERLRASVGQIYYFKNRQTGLTQNNDVSNQRSSSALAAQTMLHLHDHWTTHWDFEFEPHNDQIQKNTITVKFQPTDDRVLNVGYQYLHTNPTQTETTEQIYASMATPLSIHWHLLAKHRHDIVLHRSIDTWAGLGYDTCCAAVRLFLSRFIKPNADITIRQYDMGIYLQVIFKGFAGIGTSNMDSLIQSEIPGYRWKEKF